MVLAFSSISHGKIVIYSAAPSRSHSGSRTLILQPKEETLTQAHKTGKQNNIHWILPSPLFTNGKHRPVITCESTFPQCWGSFMYVLFSLIQNKAASPKAHISGKGQISTLQSYVQQHSPAHLSNKEHKLMLLLCVKALRCETQCIASFSHSENQGESSWNIFMGTQKSRWWLRIAGMDLSKANHA